MFNYINYLNSCDQLLNGVRKAVFTLDDKEIEKSIEEIEVVLQFLENELKDKFFGGEKIGLVDISAVFIAFWLPIIQEVKGIKLFKFEKFPKLYIWSQDFNNHPIVKEKLPTRETLLAFYNVVLLQK
jgi:glutathione S-transferase